MTKPNVAAFWLYTVALIIMAAMSASIHEAAKVATVGQLVFWRSFVALGPILIYMAARGQLGPALRTRYPQKHLIRGGLACIVMTLSFVSLSHLSVGLATALSYLTPILSICAAMVFLRERPGATIVAGVVLGFAGILLMLFPAVLGADLREGALIGVLAGLGMAATNALSRVQVKDLTRTDPPASVALSMAVICALAGLASSALGWAELDGRSFTLLIGAGLLGGVGHVMLMEAVARAPVSVLAGYEYTGIIWAFLFDLLLLGVQLDGWSIGGALVVVGAAVIVAIGQGRVKIAVAASPGAG